MQKSRWRAHLPYILTLVVLLPTALGIPWWLERQDMLDRGVIPPEATPVSGDTARLAGSEWEYVGSVTEDEEPAPGVREVSAAFKVTPDDQLATDRLYSLCAFRALDGQGRTWETALAPTELPEDVATADGIKCTAPSGTEPMPVGEQTTIVATFEVPEDAVSSLRFEVAVATHDPEIDHDMTSEEALAELEEYTESLEGEDHGHDPDSEENPPKPEALSFPYREPEGE
ncbi:hypothetical protein F4561_005951 [Lipingzhangella halophila]|uniref:Uncharacterized protein n=1 Tax=Lipingzhangella halophila TaxID=1783352 RepID=A0A7W7RN82_9ACTN|nr:hypothetical protein [Lipingzhangella halophila]MBB4935057.1 hypothetical protein [Lipingzhangella halophila]